MRIYGVKLILYDTQVNIKEVLTLGEINAVQKIAIKAYFSVNLTENITALFCKMLFLESYFHSIL